MRSAKDFFRPLAVGALHGAGNGGRCDATKKASSRHRRHRMPVSP